MPNNSNSVSLDHNFYSKDAVTVAKALLGKRLVHEIDGIRYSGIIVETEAYMGITDKASHAYGGKRTKRTETMFGAPGLSYVYLIYGMYHCFNVVTTDEGNPEAVLIRAIEPTENIDKMAMNRFGIPYDKLPTSKKKNLCNGPGKLCMAMQITKAQDKVNLINRGETSLKNRLYIEENIDSDIEDNLTINHENIISTTRIGIDYAEEAKDFLYRFYIKGNPYISKP